MQEADRARFETALGQHRAGHPEVAEPVYRALYETYPEDPELLHLLAVVAQQKGDAAAARDWVLQAIAADPDDARYRNTLGAAELALGDAAAAEAAFRAVLEREPTMADARFNLAVCLARQGDVEGAEETYHQILAMAPDHVEALNNLGGLLKTHERRGEALTYLRRAARLASHDPGVLINLADTLERLNLDGEAKRVIGRLLEVAPGLPISHILAARLEARAGDLEEAGQRLSALAMRARDPQHRMRALYDLAKVLDRLDLADEAFDALIRANRLAAEEAAADGLDPQRYVAEIETDIAWSTAERLAAPSPLTGAARVPDEPLAPVFLIGFPRSGSTLFEQMLEAHPEVVATGGKSPLAHLRRHLADRGGYPELLENASADELREMRELFWADARARFGDRLTGGRRLFDKLPLNIVNLALIGRVFPDARLIVSLRDPRDVCLSCYMQQFQPNDAMANFMNLETTTALYAKVMGFWLAARGHTPLPWLEVRYEDLIAAFEPTMREHLAFVGLPWDDAVRGYADAARGRDVSTPSYAAVVEPLNTRAQGRWQRYRSHLEPFLPTLAPFVEAFGYEPAD